MKCLITHSCVIQNINPILYSLGLDVESLRNPTHSVPEFEPVGDQSDD